MNAAARVEEKHIDLHEKFLVERGRLMPDGSPQTVGTKDQAIASGR